MERLIKHILTTLARLGNSEQTAIFKTESGSANSVLGCYNNGKFSFPNDNIVIRGTPLEEVIFTKRIHSYGGTLLNGIPFPVYETINRNLHCLCLPLLDDNKHVVAVAVLLQEHTNSSEKRLQVLNMLRGLVSSSLTLAFENDRLNSITNIDSLTGLYTQRYFESRLQEEAARINRHGGVMSVLLIDIDGFAEIDRTFANNGHTILREMSELILRSMRREVDIACRYAGEQFVMLLPNTNADGAAIVADRIQKRCEYHNFSTSQGLPVKLTVSVGIANSVEILIESEEDGELIEVDTSEMVTNDELISRAKTMLQAAQQSGGNKIMVWW